MSFLLLCLSFFPLFFPCFFTAFLLHYFLLVSMSPFFFSFLPSSFLPCFSPPLLPSSLGIFLSVLPFLSSSSSLSHSPSLCSYRFPIPDLRPEVDRHRWWEQSLRDEILLLDFSSVEFSTTVSGSEVPKEYELQFKQLKGFVKQKKKNM